MTEQDLEFLSLIGSTEETSFSELCQQLGDDCPDDKAGWRDLFAKIRDLERQCYLEVTRTQGRIDGLMLTESGAGLIRDRLDAKRGLLHL
jgi:hypothetical protein